MADAVRIPVGDLVFDADVAGPDDGELVVLLHGFPQTKLAWREVLPPLAAAGYRVVAPDQRGYSPDARPDATEAYARAELCADESVSTASTGVRDAQHAMCAMRWTDSATAQMRPFRATSPAIPRGTR